MVSSGWINPVRTAAHGRPAGHCDHGGPRAVVFTARVLRTNGYAAGAGYPKVFTIRSGAELAAFIRGAGPAYDLHGGGEASFLAAARAWDDAFFMDNRLLLILLEEGSGAVRHTVEGVTAQDGALAVRIRRDVPAFGTADMAQWHIAVAVPAALPDGPVTVIFC